MDIRRSFIVLLGLVLVAMGVYETIDPDLWWHLRTGELIWKSGIPREDPFSLTRHGVAWVTHEWLTEALMWIAYSAGGLTAISLLFAMISGAAFLLAFACSPGRPYLAGAIALLGAFAASPSFGARPQVMNMLFLALFVFVAERVRSASTAPNRLFLLPAFTIAWVNFHSGYLVGVVVLLVFAAGEIAERAVPGSSEAPAVARDRAGWYLGSAIACLLVSVANPNGWNLWIYPFETLGSDLMQQNIIEWRSPDFHLPIYWRFAAMLFLGILSWAVDSRRPPWTHVFLFLGAAAAALLSRRHVPLFAIVAVPIIASSLTGNLRGVPLFARLHGDADRAAGRGSSLLNRGVVVVGVITLLAATIPKLAANESVIAATYPVAAVDFIERERLDSGRIFNAYIWGGYLVWRGIRPFIDGRADVYGPFFGDYLKTSRLTEDWRILLEEYAVDYVLLENGNSLVSLLIASGEWRVAYRDDVAVVLVLQ